MRMDSRTKEVLLAFCDGMAPSQIDSRMGMEDGIAHAIVTKWWADDKEHRTGLYDEIVGRKIAGIIRW